MAQLLKEGPTEKGTYIINSDFAFKKAMYDSMVKAFGMKPKSNEYNKKIGKNTYKKETQWYYEVPFSSDEEKDLVQEILLEWNTKNAANAQFFAQKIEEFVANHPLAIGPPHTARYTENIFARLGAEKHQIGFNTYWDFVDGVDANGVEMAPAQERFDVAMALLQYEVHITDPNAKYSRDTLSALGGVYLVRTSVENNKKSGAWVFPPNAQLDYDEQAQRINDALVAVELGGNLTEAQKTKLAIDVDLQITAGVAEEAWGYAISSFEAVENEKLAQTIAAVNKAERIYLARTKEDDSLRIHGIDGQPVFSLKAEAQKILGKAEKEITTADVTQQKSEQYLERNRLIEGAGPYTLDEGAKTLAAQIVFPGENKEQLGRLVHKLLEESGVDLTAKIEAFVPQQPVVAMGPIVGLSDDKEFVLLLNTSIRNGVEHSEVIALPRAQFMSSIQKGHESSSLSNGSLLAKNAFNNHTRDLEKAIKDGTIFAVGAHAGVLVSIDLEKFGTKMKVRDSKEWNSRTYFEQQEMLNEQIMEEAEHGGIFYGVKYAKQALRDSIAGVATPKELRDADAKDIAKVAQYEKALAAHKAAYAKNLGAWNDRKAQAVNKTITKLVAERTATEGMHDGRSNPARKQGKITEGVLVEQQPIVGYPVGTVVQGLQGHGLAIFDKQTIVKPQKWGTVDGRSALLPGQYQSSGSYVIVNLAYSPNRFTASSIDKCKGGRQVDKQGNSLYVQKLDEHNEPVFDQDHNPVYQEKIVNGKIVRDERGNVEYQELPLLAKSIMTLGVSQGHLAVLPKDYSDNQPKINEEIKKQIAFALTKQQEEQSRNQDRKELSSPYDSNIHHVVGHAENEERERQRRALQEVCDKIAAENNLDYKALYFKKYAEEKALKTKNNVREAHAEPVGVSLNGEELPEAKPKPVIVTRVEQQDMNEKGIFANILNFKSYDHRKGGKSTGTFDGQVITKMTAKVQMAEGEFLVVNTKDKETGKYFALGLNGMGGENIRVRSEDGVEQYRQPQAGDTLYISQINTSANGKPEYRIELEAQQQLDVEHQARLEEVSRRVDSALPEKTKRALEPTVTFDKTDQKELEAKMRQSLLAQGYKNIKKVEIQPVNYMGRYDGTLEPMRDFTVNGKRVAAVLLNSDTNSLNRAAYETEGVLKVIAVIEDDHKPVVRDTGVRGNTDEAKIGQLFAEGQKSELYPDGRLNASGAKVSVAVRNSQFVDFTITRKSDLSIGVDHEIAPEQDEHDLAVVGAHETNVHWNTVSR